MRFFLRMWLTRNLLLEGGFWLAFLVMPIFMGWLAYDCLPNESFNAKKHIALDSEFIDGPDGVSYVSSSAAFRQSSRCGFSASET